MTWSPESSQDLFMLRDFRSTHLITALGQWPFALSAAAPAYLHWGSFGPVLRRDLCSSTDFVRFALHSSRRDNLPCSARRSTVRASSSLRCPVGGGAPSDVFDGIAALDYGMRLALQSTKMISAPVRLALEGLFDD